MKSALECFQHAQHCERMAQVSADVAGRTALLDAAAQWRKLGKEAERRDKAMLPERKP